MRLRAAGLFALLIAVCFCCIPAIASNPYDVLVARGDPINFQTNISGSIWIFSENGNSHLYDSAEGMPVAKFWTQGADEGLYNLYVQNKSFWLKEISISQKNNRVFLYSPYKFVRDIDITDMPAYDVEKAFIGMINGTHDSIEMYRLKIENPYIRVNKVSQIGNQTLRAEGVTNLAAGTKLTAWFDANRLVSQRDFAQHSFYAVAEGSLEGPRTFVFNITEDLQKFPAGRMEHNLTVFSESGIKTFAPFYLWQAIDWEPARNTSITYLSDGVIATPTPEIIRVREIETQYVDRWYTATPTPEIRNAINQTVDYPYQPVNIFGIGILVLAVMGIVGIIAYVIRHSARLRSRWQKFDDMVMELMGEKK